MLKDKICWVLFIVLLEITTDRNLIKWLKIKKRNSTAKADNSAIKFLKA